MSTLQQSSRPRLAVTAWWVIVVMISVHLLPFAVESGMFMDGTMYAAIARNMALGFGDVWHPAFSPGTGDHFYKEPTLAFLLQSYAFRVFGDHFWVEKLYSAATGLVTVVIVAAIWRRLVGRQSSLTEYSWLPIMLWLIWPRWTWQYENNWLENTMIVFTSFAVYCGLRTSDSSSSGMKWIVAGGLSMLAGVLSKGPTGLFPLVTPLVAWATLRRQTWIRALATNAAWVFFFCAGFGLVLLQPAARECISEYLHQQLLPSLAGQRGLTLDWGQFYILKAIQINLRVPALATVAVILIDYLRRRYVAQGSQPSSPASDMAPPTRAFFFSLMTAASASLPIILSPKQLTHYAFQSYPFFALALALSCAPALERLLSAAKLTSTQRAHRLIRAAAGATVVVLACVSTIVAGRPHVDEEKLHDTFVLGRLLPSGTVVGTSPGFLHEWYFCAYLSRWDNIGVDHHSDNHDYLLAPMNEIGLSPAGYEVVPSDMVRYRLYRRSDVAGASTDCNGTGVGRVGQTTNRILR